MFIYDVYVLISMNAYTTYCYLDNPNHFFTTWLVHGLHLKDTQSMRLYILAASLFCWCQETVEQGVSDFDLLYRIWSTAWSPMPVMPSKLGHVYRQLITFISVVCWRMSCVDWQLMYLPPVQTVVCSFTHTHLNLMHYNTRLEIHYHVQLKWRRGGTLSVIQVVK